MKCGCIGNHTRFFNKLKKSQSPSYVIAKAKDEEIRCLIELIYNITGNKVPLYRYEKKKVSKVMPVLERVGNIRDYKRARKELVQTGGSIIPIIINAALALIELLKK